MVRMKSLESLVVKFLDELRERALPGFLPVIVELTEFLGVHPEFSCHLNLFVGQAMTPLCLDPTDHFLRKSWLTHNAPRAGGFARFQDREGQTTARLAGESGRASLVRGAVADLEEVAVQFVDAPRGRPTL
jgi:hypothetical protein